MVSKNYNDEDQPRNEVDTCLSHEGRYTRYYAIILQLSAGKMGDLRGPSHHSKISPILSPIEIIFSLSLRGHTGST